MGSIHCPFCGASVQVGSHGAVQPRCPRCGAHTESGAAPEAQAALSTGTAPETRRVAGPAGEVRFRRATDAAEPPGGLQL